MVCVQVHFMNAHHTLTMCIDWPTLKLTLLTMNSPLYSFLICIVELVMLNEQQNLHGINHDKKVNANIYFDIEHLSILYDL